MTRLRSSRRICPLMFPSNSRQDGYSLCSFVLAQQHGVRAPSHRQYGKLLAPRTSGAKLQDTRNTVHDYAIPCRLRTKVKRCQPSVSFQRPIANTRARLQWHTGARDCMSLLPSESRQMRASSSPSRGSIDASQTLLDLHDHNIKDLWYPSPVTVNKTGQDPAIPASTR